MFDAETITTNGRAAFYAALYPSLCKSVAECGWALGLHGSIHSDLDIMAMPWTDTATDADTMVEKLINDNLCGNNISRLAFSKDTTSKPNGRVVYTIPIFADFYIDLNVIQRDDSDQTL